MIIKGPYVELGKVLVTFKCPGSCWLQEINLVGDFCGWQADAFPMKRSLHNNYWYCTVPLEKGRAYQFRYLINRAQWCNDAEADDYAPNPYGSVNSVVIT